MEGHALRRLAASPRLTAPCIEWQGKEAVAPKGRELTARPMFRTDCPTRP